MIIIVVVVVVVIIIVVIIIVVVVIVDRFDSFCFVREPLILFGIESCPGPLPTAQVWNLVCVRACARA